MDRSSTFLDLLVKLAAQYGDVRYDTATARPLAPASSDLRHKLAMDINSGAKMFYLGNPKWRWARSIVDTQIGPKAIANRTDPADSTRYLLPLGVISTPRVRCVWMRLNATTGVIERGGEVIVKSIDAIDRFLATNPSASGVPACVSVRPARQVATMFGARTRYELVVYPKPNEAYTIRALYSFGVQPLVDDADRPMWPDIHDETVLALASLQRARRGDGSVTVREAQDHADRMLASSIAADNELGPPSLDPLTDGGASAYAGSGGTVRNFDGTLITTFT
jgi:hypothetical protein